MNQMVSGLSGVTPFRHVAAGALFLFFPFFGAFLGGFFLGLDFVVDLFGLLVFGIIHAHAGQLVLDCHHGMGQEHALLGAVHDGHEFLRLFCTEAGSGAVATVTDGFRDAVGTAVHLGHNRCQQGRAFWAEFVAFRIMMTMAIYAEGLFDVFLFLGNIVFDFYRLTLGQKTRKNAHFVSPFDINGYIIHHSILMVFQEKSKGGDNELLTCS